MKPVMAAVLRSRIRVGSCETFAFQTAKCPRCQQTLCLTWPEHILEIPLHRVVWLDCPGCANSFSVLAGDLVPVCGDDLRFQRAVVSYLS
jgi:hypothetical protein